MKTVRGVPCLTNGFFGRMDVDFIESFGDDVAPALLKREDRISVISFDPAGKFLAVGDHGGRIIIFSIDDNPKTGPKFSFVCQIEAHISEFDYLRSVFSSKTVNSIKWVPTTVLNPLFLSCNSSQVKLWRLDYTKEFSWENSSGNSFDTFIPPIPSIKHERYFPTHVKSFNDYSGDFNVEICCLEDQKSFLSIGENNVSLWDFELSKPVTIVRSTPDPNQSVAYTTASVHRSLPFSFLVGDSLGNVKLYDLRQQPEDISPSISISLSTFSTEATVSGTQPISSIIFSRDARTFTVRTFGDLQMWDFRNMNAPIATANVQWYPTQMDWIISEGFINDKFDMAMMPDGSIITGKYSCDFVSWNPINKTKCTHRAQSAKAKKPTDTRLDFNKKVTAVGAHPTNGVFAVAPNSSLFIFKGKTHQ
ncbi:protein phosphatase PP2A regulatory subunit B [Histomonas meleagridis]|uniref:protein phosphatase PP2A regulatory subunit B n=1 Tax=Histomonas meleagridis TaxID=135588 RepID=UPI0035597FEF|nr:protein phosphatase PP2A regulatory subunit B [Histomonas meleagridis]KAH0803420.1 protein phosphatase PP2A regulatory subunit B [Histomonas meleagridis]